jgi:hypothetical protein
MVKGDGESLSQNTYVLSDTSPRVVGTIKTWTQVCDILQYELDNCPKELDYEGTENQETKLKYISQSELHKIATRPRLIPYNDVIGWALSNVDVTTRTIYNSQKVVVGSFRSEHIQVMYKLSPAFKHSCNTSFLKEFNKEECPEGVKNYPDLIKYWWEHPEKFRADTYGIYTTASLDSHMMCVVMILCRIFRRENSAHFLLSWVSIMYEVAEGFSFNWAKILSDSLAKEITKYQTLKAKGRPAPFYMSAYLMDAICFMTHFPLMGWSWTPISAKPIHIYHSKLWKDKAKDFFYEICNYVVVSMHVAIYGCPPPRISKKIVTNLGKIKDWYIEENFSYIMVFGCSVPPHALPKFLPDRLVCHEVAHQTVLGGINTELKAV